MIYYKLYDFPNQTTQPGTLANAKNRFHHHKASGIKKTSETNIHIYDRFPRTLQTFMLAGT